MLAFNHQRIPNDFACALNRCSLLLRLELLSPEYFESWASVSSWFDRFGPSRCWRRGRDSCWPPRWACQQSPARTKTSCDEPWRRRKPQSWGLRRSLCREEPFSVTALATCWTISPPRAGSRISWSSLRTLASHLSTSLNPIFLPRDFHLNKFCDG